MIPRDGSGERPDNPYVGPRAFRYGETLYGRGRETEDLCDLLTAQRIVLLYSPSGAGKSSLLEAALRPALESRRFLVLPTIRVGHPMAEPESKFAPSSNRYVRSTLLSLTGDTGDRALVEQVLEIAGDRSEDDPCLLIDQFEELFADPTNAPSKAAFLEQLGVALRHAGLWAVLAMREDYVAQLDPYLSLLPTRLRARYRLDLLGPAAALAAARLPAMRAGVVFSDVAAERLIDDLRQVRVTRDGRIAEAKGSFVEPVQLQVVCRQLWNALAPGDEFIELRHLEAIGSIDDSLARFYADAVAAAATASGVSERTIRSWVDKELITANGFRSQVAHGPDVAGDHIVRQLEDAHLLRSESRRGTQWYELAHDRLVRPVQANNAEWAKDHLSSPLLQAAKVWGEKRDPGLLITGPLLKEQDAWAQAHTEQLDRTDREFLEASKAEHRRRAFVRRLGWLAAVLAVVMVVATSIAFVAYRRAEDERSNAEREAALRNAGQLRSAAATLPEDRVSLRALLVQAADRLLGQATDEVGPESRASVAEMLGEAERSTTVLERLEGIQPGVGMEAMWTDEELIAVGDSSGALRLWSTRDGVLRGEEFASVQLPGGVHAIVHDPAHGVVAVGWGEAEVEGGRIEGGPGGLELIDLTSSPIRTRPLPVPGGGPVSTLAVAGNRLAVGRWDGTLALLDLADGSVVWQSRVPPLRAPGPTECNEAEAVGDRKVRAFAIVGDGRWLAAGTNNCLILVWELSAMGEARVLEGHEDKVRALTTRPGSNVLLSTGDDRSLRVWNLGAPEGQEQGATTPDLDAARVLALCVTPDGGKLTAAGRTGVVHRFDLLPDGRVSTPGEVFVGHNTTVRAVACPSSSRFISLASDSLVAWDEERTSRTGVAVDTVGERVEDVVFVPGGDGSGQLVVVTSSEGQGTLMVFDGERMLASRPLAFVPHAVDASPDGTWLGVAGESGEPVLGRATRYEATALREVHVAEAPQPLRAVTVSDDGRLAAAGDNGALVVVDPNGVQQQTETTGVRVGSLAFTPDGNRLLVGDQYGDLSCYSADGGADRLGWVNLGREVLAVAVASDGSVAAGTADDITFLYLDALDDGTDCDPSAWASTELRGHTADVTGAAFDLDGDLLVAAAHDGTAAVWDVRTAGSVATLRVASGDSPSRVTIGPGSIALAQDTRLLLFPLDRNLLRSRLCELAERSMTTAETEYYLTAERAEVGTCDS